MKKIFLGILILTIFITNLVCSQPKHDEKFRILKQYRKLELLKQLNLSEDQELTVLPLLNDIDQNREQQFKKHKEVSLKIEKALKKSGNEKELRKLTTELMENEKALQERERKLYINLRDNIGERKFAEYLLFQINFGRHLREKMDRMHQMRKGDFPK